MNTHTYCLPMGGVFVLLLTACEGRHKSIQEYDCNASSNGCPTGFECELDPDGRGLCIDRRGAQPDALLPVAPDRDASLPYEPDQGLIVDRDSATPQDAERPLPRDPD